MANLPDGITIVDEVFESLCKRYSHNTTFCAAFEMFRNEVHFTDNNNYLLMMEKIKYKSNVKYGMEMLKNGSNNI